MKQIKTKSFGVELTRNVPSSYAELDKALGGEGKGLETVIKEVTWKRDLPQIIKLAIAGRSANNGTPAFEGLEKLTGKPRASEQKQVKAGKGGTATRTITVITEENDAYIERLFGTVESWKGTPPAQLVSVLTAASNAVQFNPPLTGHNKADKPLAARWLKEATKFVAAPPALAALQTKLQTVLGRQYKPVVATPVDATENLQALGRLCKDLTEFGSNQARAALAVK